MDAVQVNNGRRILWATRDYGAEQGWDKWTTRRAARLAIMCALTESGLRIYANSGIPASLDLPHDATGHDHASVGLFQQQTPMWGPVRSCMSPVASTWGFLTVLAGEYGRARFLGTPARTMIQKVQVSAYPDGSNYQRNARASFLFVLRYWNLVTGRPYGNVPPPWAG